MLILTLLIFTTANSENLVGRILHPFPRPHDAPNTAQLITGNHYPVEVHSITTEDGYILNVFRIPHGTTKKKGFEGVRKPVLIQHGVLYDSGCWAIITPKKGLPYLLADGGYDVWLGNSRGTTYGLRHTNLTTKDEKFWDFSVHELGYYDLPAMIDYILNKTKYKKLAFIGHSQGTTSFFIMASTRPEYNNKVAIVTALAPVAYIANTNGPSVSFAYFSKFLAVAAKILDIHYVFGHSKILQFLGSYCSKNTVVGRICNQVLFSFIGADSPQTNQTLVSQTVEYFPTGASVKQVIHYGQLASNGKKFTYFDYGTKENIKRYKMATPPEYDLSKVTAPVAIYHAQNDLISTAPEVVRLSQMLPNLVNRTLIDFKLFNHLDFIWAIDVKPLLNDHIIALLNKYIYK